MLACMMLSIFTTSMAQSKVLSGRVTDYNGDPLIGAHVKVTTGKQVATATDQNGRYELRIPSSSASGQVKVEFSFVGYVPQVIALSQKQQSSEKLNVRLQEDFASLDQVVVTGTRTPKALKDVPVVTRVVSSEDIAKVDATNVQDLLTQEVPGLEFGYAMNQQTSLNLGGFSGNAILFLVDGERMSGETMDNIDYNRLNLDNVGRIEIVKGAASTLYGSAAVGGVINLISRESTEPWTANVNTRYVDEGHQWRHGARFSFKAGKVTSSTNFQYSKSDPIILDDDPNSDSYVTQVFADMNYNVKERIVYRPTEHLKLTGRLGYYYRERKGAVDIYDHYRDYSGGLKGEYDFGQGRNLELSYSYDQYDKADYNIHTKLDIRDYSNVQHVTRLLYNHTLAKVHTLTLGADYMRDYLMSYQFEGNGSKVQHSADAFLQFDYNPTSHVNILAGGRFDYFSASESAAGTGKFAFMYKWRQASLRAGYSGGFRAPSLKEMYMEYDMAGVWMIYGKDNLKPEYSHNFSITGEHGGSVTDGVLRGKYNMTLTGNMTFFKDRITTHGITRDGVYALEYENLEDFKNTSIDANVQYRTDMGLGLKLSYCFTHEFDGSQSTWIPTRPHTATARLDYDHQWRHYGLNVALSGRLLSKVSYLTEAEDANGDYILDENGDYTYITTTDEGYSIWKLLITNRIWRGININLSIDNIFGYRPKEYNTNSPTVTGTTFSIGASVDLDRLFKK